MILRTHGTRLSLLGIIQDLLLTSRSGALITSAKPLSLYMVTPSQILGRRMGTSLRVIILPLSLDGLQDSRLSHLKASSWAMTYAGDHAHPWKLSTVQSLAWIAWFLLWSSIFHKKQATQSPKADPFPRCEREIGRAAIVLWLRLCHT